MKLLFLHPPVKSHIVISFQSFEQSGPVVCLFFAHAYWLFYPFWLVVIRVFPLPTRAAAMFGGTVKSTPVWRVSSRMNKVGFHRWKLFVILVMLWSTLCLGTIIIDCEIIFNFKIVSDGDRKGRKMRSAASM